MATISMATPRMIWNSSYVLIRHHPFPQDSERDGSTSPGCPGKYIILSRWCPCGGAGDVFSFDKLFPTLYNICLLYTSNIVGASGAILTGGPGAIFWMWIIAFFGMATIYAEAVLAQKTRVKNEDGQYLGGPVYYIRTALDVYKRQATRGSPTIRWARERD